MWQLKIYVAQRKAWNWAAKAKARTRISTGAFSQLINYDSDLKNWRKLCKTGVVTLTYSWWVMTKALINFLKSRTFWRKICWKQDRANGIQDILRDHGRTYDFQQKEIWWPFLCRMTIGGGRGCKLSKSPNYEVFIPIILKKKRL